MDTLILVPLPPRSTLARAPDPGPLLKRDWQPIAAKYVEGQRVVMHADSAKVVGVGVRLTEGG